MKQAPSLPSDTVATGRRIQYEGHTQVRRKLISQSSKDMNRKTPSVTQMCTLYSLLYKICQCNYGCELNKEGTVLINSTVPSTITGFG